MTYMTYKSYKTYKTYKSKMSYRSYPNNKKRGTPLKASLSLCSLL